MGRDLYKRIATFGEHLARTGKGLDSAVDAYNKAVGSLERNVLPQARRFHELGVVGGGGQGAASPSSRSTPPPATLQAPELVAGRPALSAVPSAGDDAPTTPRGALPVGPEPRPRPATAGAQPGDGAFRCSSKKAMIRARGVGRRGLVVVASAR